MLQIGKGGDAQMRRVHVDKDVDGKSGSKKEKVLTDWEVQKRWKQP
jgi:hypothetical protein